MVPETKQQITLNNPPTGNVNLSFGNDDSTFKYEKGIKINELKSDELLIKVLLISNDPTQRGWMNKSVNPRLYTKPILKGEMVTCFAIGKVIASKCSEYREGSIVVGKLGWADFVVVSKENIMKKIDTSIGIPLQAYLGSLGVTGLTAYIGLTKIGNFQKGQSIIVSAASGATGSMVIQIAKHILGASRVIGITGSGEKAAWVKSLGADETLNYNSPNFKNDLDKIIGTDYVDVYFDNVGGEILDASISKVKAFGTVVACGAISGYNDHEKSKVYEWSNIILNRLTVRGFLVLDYSSSFSEAIGAIIEGVSSGKIKLTEDTGLVDVTSEDVPLKRVPVIWNRLFTNEKPNGKLVTQISST